MKYKLSKIISWALLLSCVFFCISGSIFAQNKITGEKKPLDINADRMDYNEKEKQVRLIGNVRFQLEQMLMSAPYAQYKVKTQVADFQGGVKITQPGTTVTARNMQAFYGDNKAVLSGQVRCIFEKSPLGQDRTPAVFTADEVTYQWVLGLVTAKGKVTVRQGAKKARADRAVYNKSADIVDLEGNVSFEQSGDEWLVGQHVTLDLAKESAVATGQVMGRFYIDQKKEISTPETPENSLSLPGVRLLEPLLPFDTERVVEPMLLPDLDGK